uniref:Smoothened, frizzled class receptor n=1 Tax=Macrostomum lignano TaxID=282301 RepID=A0A1I8IUL3_9PLAT
SIDSRPGHAASGIEPSSRDGPNGVINSRLLALVVLPYRLLSLGRSHQRDCLLRGGSNCSAHRVLGTSTLAAERNESASFPRSPRIVTLRRCLHLYRELLKEFLSLVGWQEARTRRTGERSGREAEHRPGAADGTERRSDCSDQRSNSSTASLARRCVVEGPSGAQILTVKPWISLYRHLLQCDVRQAALRVRQCSVPTRSVPCEDPYGPERQQLDGRHHIADHADFAHADAQHCPAPLPHIRRRNDQQRRHRRQRCQHQWIRWAQLALYSAACAFSVAVCVALQLTICCRRRLRSRSRMTAHGGLLHSLRLSGGVRTGEMKTCRYALYLAGATAGFTLMWGLLFALVSNGRGSGGGAPAAGGRNGHLRRLIFPSLLFNSVLCTSQIISSCVLTLGQTYWCKAVLRDLDDSETANKLAAEVHGGLTCAAIQSMPWQLSGCGGGPLSEGDTKGCGWEGARYLYFRGPRYLSLMTTAQLASWTVSVVLLALSVLCGERFFRAVWFGEFEGDDGSFDVGAVSEERAELVASGRRARSQRSSRAAGTATESVVETASASNGLVRENAGAAKKRAFGTAAADEEEEEVPAAAAPARWREAASPLWEPRTPAAGRKQAAAAGMSAAAPTDRPCCRFCSPGCRGRGCSSAHGAAVIGHRAVNLKIEFDF